MATTAGVSSFNELFNTFGTSMKNAELESFITLIDRTFAPDVKFRVVSQPGMFALAGNGQQGLQGLKEYCATVLGPTLMATVDASKSLDYDVTNVISGNNDGRFAVEFKQVGTTKAGQFGLLYPTLPTLGT